MLQRPLTPSLPWTYIYVLSCMTRTTRDAYIRLGIKHFYHCSVVPKTDTNFMTVVKKHLLLYRKTADQPTEGSYSKMPRVFSSEKQNGVGIRIRLKKFVMKYLLTRPQVLMMRAAQMKVKNILHNTLLQNHLEATNQAKMRINNRSTTKINTHVVVDVVVDTFFIKQSDRNI